MKKIINIFLCGLLLLSLSACGNSNTGSQQHKGTYPDFLVGKDWEYNSISCTEVLHFSAEGDFSYYETCGNPVGDSDLYETYSYDEEAKIITAYGYDKSVKDKEIQVLRYTDDSLLVRIDGAMKEFYTESYVPSLYADESEYVMDYSAYMQIGDINNGIIQTAPLSADMDAGGREMIREEKLAEDVAFYGLYVEIIHGSEDEGEEVTSEFTELKLEDVAYSEDNSMGAGFVWYNEDMEITKIVYYGSLEIWE